MDVINSLVELETTIKKVYLKLIECEIINNFSDCQIVKEMLFRLIDRENIIFKQIINDNNLLLELDNFLSENLYQDLDMYDEMFLKGINGKYETLVLLRIYNRFNNNLIYLTNDQVSDLANEKLLEELDISYSRLGEMSIFNWNILNLIENTAVKLELLGLNDKIKNNNYRKKDYESLVYYRDLLVYTNPILEKYVFGNQELTATVSNIFNDYDSYSNDYKKVYFNNLENSVVKNIYYIINVMINNIDYSDYLCSEEIMDIIYLTGIEANLKLLREDYLREINDSFNKTLNTHSIMLLNNGKYDKALTIKTLLEKYDVNKVLKK